MSRKIKVTIDAMGNPSIDAIGFKGQGCTDATKVIETALASGAGEMTRELKPEWSETEDVVHNTQIGQGW